MRLKTIFNRIFCPYKTSSNRAIYEKVAREYGMSPNRLYKIAHGHHSCSLSEIYALNELNRLGIV